MEQLVPGSAAHTIPVALRLRGALDAGALGLALGDVADRHEALRMRIRPGRTGARGPGARRGRIAAAAARPVGRVRRRGAGPRRRGDRGTLRPRGRPDGPGGAGAAGRRRSRARAGGAPHRLRRLVGRHPARGPVRALRSPARRAAAGAAPSCPSSTATTRSGNGTGCPAPPTAISPTGSGGWPRCRRSIWSTDRPRPAEQTYDGTAHGFRLDAALTRSVLDLARQRDATPYMVLLAGFQVLLGRYAGAATTSPSAPRSRAARCRSWSRSSAASSTC